MATFEKRILRDGTAQYRVKIRVKGFPSVSGSFERLTDAKRWAQKVEVEMRDRKYSQPFDQRIFTLTQAFEKYSTHLKYENPRRLKEICLILSWWNAQIGGMQVSELNKSKLLECRQALLTEDIGKPHKPRYRGNATVNRYVSVLNTVMNYVSGQLEWIDENPIRNIKNLTESKGRNRYLNDEERKSLLSACRRSSNPYLYPIVVLAISCGARKSEISTIKWESVDLDKGIIVLNKTKNKETRILHLHGEAYEEIKALYNKRDISDKFVFSSKTNHNKSAEFKTSWYTALKRANLSNFKFHDLRHTAASYLAMNGANTKDIAQILGHKSLEMTNRYAHLCDSHTSVVIESMNERIFGRK